MSLLRCDTIHYIAFARRDVCFTDDESFGRGSMADDGDDGGVVAK